MKKNKWKTLGEICEIKTGQQINKRKIFENKGIYPVINSGKQPLGYINTWNTEDDPIGITTRGAGVGSITYQIGKYFRGNLNYSVTIKNNRQLNTRFLYHLLLEFQKSIYKLCTFDGIPALNSSEIKKLEIPLPPLKKQAKIAAVLDKFTELTEELTAELTGREAQYDYYRNLLLSEEYIDKKRSQFVKIKEICIKQKGINITAKEMKQLNKKNTPIKIFGGGNTSVTVDKKDINVDIISKPSIIVKSRGNIDFEFYDKPFTHKNELWSYSSKNNNLLNIKYLYYYLKNEIEYFKNKAIHGRMPQISNGITDNYSFYLPPIETQNKIIKFLDSFEALVNDIKQGLPKEIELRQKQYKYYREKLLTF